MLRIWPVCDEGGGLRPKACFAWLCVCTRGQKWGKHVNHSFIATLLHGQRFGNMMTNSCQLRSVEPSDIVPGRGSAFPAGFVGSRFLVSRFSFSLRALRQRRRPALQTALVQGFDVCSSHMIFRLLGFAQAGRGEAVALWCLVACARACCV